MSDTVLVDVIVREDGEEIFRFYLSYYPGQDYTVAVDTPDGRDRVVDLVAGGASKTWAK